jgi:hypothetical protein
MVVQMINTIDANIKRKPQSDHELVYIPITFPDLG